jgi:AcrR family transcriptional regulator
MATTRQAPVRRNQADRTAQTRRKILDAVVACIEEEGFARTTSQRIARRAGVSVGAVQHHFMSKADILRAVLEESFDELSAAFDGVSLDGASLEERVSVFVARAWGHYGSRRFRSTLEIIFGTRNSLEPPESDWAAGPMLESRARAQRLWDSIFSDQGLSRERQGDLLRFAFVNLAGLSMTTRFERNEARTDRQVALIEDALLALLRAPEV